MKTLSVTYLIGALMLGLFAAWVAAVPQQLAASDTVGGWDCNGTKSTWCTGSCLVTFRACRHGDRGLCQADCFKVGDEIICSGGCKYADPDCSEYVIHAICGTYV